MIPQLLLLWRRIRVYGLLVPLICLTSKLGNLWVEPNLNLIGQRTVTTNLHKLNSSKSTTCQVNQQWSVYWNFKNSGLIKNWLNWPSTWPWQYYWTQLFTIPLYNWRKRVSKEHIQLRMQCVYPILRLTNIAFNPDFSWVNFLGFWKIWENNFWTLVISKIETQIHFHVRL